MKTHNLQGRGVFFINQHSNQARCRLEADASRPAGDFRLRSAAAWVFIFAGHVTVAGANNALRTTGSAKSLHSVLIAVADLFRGIGRDMGARRNFTALCRKPKPKKRY